MLVTPEEVTCWLEGQGVVKPTNIERTNESTKLWFEHIVIAPVDDPRYEITFCYNSLHRNQLSRTYKVGEVVKITWEY